jgi:hypothetical protein
MLQTPNMTMEFHDTVVARAGSGRHWLCGPKISKNLCGVFNALCYIPAPLTNQNSF